MLTDDQIKEMNPFIIPELESHAPVLNKNTQSPPEMIEEYMTRPIYCANCKKEIDFNAIRRIIGNCAYEFCFDNCEDEYYLKFPALKNEKI